MNLWKWHRRAQQQSEIQKAGGKGLDNNMDYNGGSVSCLLTAILYPCLKNDFLGLRKAQGGLNRLERNLQSRWQWVSGCTILIGVEQDVLVVSASTRIGGHQRKLADGLFKGKVVLHEKYIIGLLVATFDAGSSNSIGVKWWGEIHQGVFMELFWSWAHEEGIWEVLAHYPSQGIFRLDAHVDRPLIWYNLAILL